jgi:hypothetical protein
MCMAVQTFIRVCGIGTGTWRRNTNGEPGCIPVTSPFSPGTGEIPHPTSQEFFGPVAPDGDTIMTTESRTSEKPIMIFPVFIVKILVRYFHGSVTRRIILVYHLITKSFLRADKYPKSPGLEAVTPGFKGRTPGMTE